MACLVQHHPDAGLVHLPGHQVQFHAFVLALGKAGARIVERFDTSVSELELRYANNKLIGDEAEGPEGNQYRRILAGQVPGSDFYIVGGITEVNGNLYSSGFDAGMGEDGRASVLGDHTCQLSPEGWARRVAEVYSLHEADRVVAERNFGGAMVEAVLRAAAPDLPVKVVTASRGKVARAEPIAALYEQGKVSHVGGFAALEDQCCSMTPSGYVGEGSPDRADALVWALTELALGSQRDYDLSTL